MENPFVQSIVCEFDHLDFRDAELVRESYHKQNFGNAMAIYKLGNLRLYFIRDRGHDTIDFLNPNDIKDIYTFSDMSLVMGWITLNELIRKYKTVDFDKPPIGPIPLSSALKLIKNDYNQLQEMFSSPKICSTIKKLRDFSEKRCNAFFRQ